MTALNWLYNKTDDETELDKRNTKHERLPYDVHLIANNTAGDCAKVVIHLQCAIRLYILV